MIRKAVVSRSGTFLPFEEVFESKYSISTSIWFPLILFLFKVLLFIKLSIVRFNVRSRVRSVSFVY